MYLEHFKLSRNPFPSTPQLDFFFSGGGRTAAINAIDYALQENFGIVKIIGQTGVGKTMLCRQAYRELSEKYDILFLSDPSLDSTHSILAAVASELNPEWDLSRPKNKLFQQVMQTLIKQKETGKPTILFIEEAQKLTTEQFEELRYLTNLETSQDKLLQIILFGQPELDSRLMQADAQLLSSRLTHSIYLNPLSRKDFVDYLHHRLAIAGILKPEVFIPTALVNCIFFLSQGSLRQANQILEKTLFAAYLRKADKPNFFDIAAAVRSMSRKGAEVKYTRKQLASVFSIGIFFGWVAFTATAPAVLH